MGLPCHEKRLGKKIAALIFWEIAPVYHRLGEVRNRSHPELFVFRSVIPQYSLGSILKMWVEKTTKTITKGDVSTVGVLGVEKEKKTRKLPFQNDSLN
jgi:hypothetical protein